MITLPVIGACGGAGLLLFLGTLLGILIWSCLAAAGRADDYSERVQDARRKDAERLQWKQQRKGD